MKGEGDDMVGVVGTITIIVDGSTTLNSRTLNLAVKLDLVGGRQRPRTGFHATSLTVWKLNGTVFLANFVNGNNDVFHSRVYLFNHGPVSGDITVRVFTLPTSGEVHPQWEQLHLAGEPHVVVGKEYPSGGRCVDAHTGRDGAALHYRRW